MKNILNVKINDEINAKEVIEYLDDSINNKIPRLVCTTNPEFVMCAQTNEKFKDILNSSDLSLPDGAGVLYALKYLDLVSKLTKNSRLVFTAKALLTGLSMIFVPKKELGTTITGVSLFYQLCSLANDRGYTVFLLGGWPKNTFGKPLTNAEVTYDLATLCKHTLEKMYPNIKIIGASSSFNYKEYDDVATVSYIKECMLKEHVTSVDMLFVAYGHPKQELWLERNRNKIPALVSVGVGGTFDFVTGIQKRAPKLFIRLNLEWFYRLLTQPWRIKRIFSAFPLFPLSVFKSVVSK